MLRRLVYHDAKSNRLIGLRQRSIYVNKALDWIVNRHRVKLYSTSTAVNWGASFSAKSIQGRLRGAGRARYLDMSKVGKIERDLFFHQQHFNQFYYHASDGRVPSQLAHVSKSGCFPVS